MGDETVSDGRARAADERDADEMVRLAAVMFAAMGLATPDRWWADAREVLLAHLGTAAFGFVVDHPDATPGGPRRLAAGAVVMLGPRLPNPRYPGPAQAGYVQWVATDPDCRRRGYARAVLEALVAWCDQRAIPRVELHATAPGEPLYRSLGFDPGEHLHLSRFRT